MSQSRPRLGCLIGTFNPSRRQIRATRLGIHMPALSTQQRRDPAIAIAPKLAGKIDDRFRKRRFVVRHLGNMPLGRTRLAKNMAGSTFGNAKRLLDMMHANPTTLNARSVQGLRSFPTRPLSG